MAAALAPLGAAQAQWLPQACVVQRSVVRVKPAPLTGPVELTALDLSSRASEETVATGEVALRRGGLTLTADSLRYLHASERALAEGHVHLERNGDTFDGQRADMDLANSVGSVTGAHFHVARAGAGGRADRVEFTGSKQVRAEGAAYSSCDLSPGQNPDWVLTMDKLSLDFERNEGLAQGAVLRFLDVPILAMPVLSFPATDQPKSGWLPPTIDLSTNSGIVISDPYYWRIAPNLDATFAPVLSSKRGAGLRGDFRYLQPSDSGRFEYHALPNDQAARQDRYSTLWAHEGSAWQGLHYDLSYQQASDDSYWKDFSKVLPSWTPRLLPQQAHVSQQSRLAGVDVEVYSRVQSWQVLQDSTDTITPPYQRLPQVGLRARVGSGQGLHYELETEANHFRLGTLPSSFTASNTLPYEGKRVHALQSLWLPLDAGWGWLTPRVALNSASYVYNAFPTDASGAVTSSVSSEVHRSRAIPTVSLDMGLRFEQELEHLGQDLVTLEPRLHYVRTPRRTQSDLPLFDTAGADFSAVSIYADNTFTGVDRVSDASQMTFGFTSRVLNRDNGVERLRFGAAQRYQFRAPELTADGSSGTSSGSRFSDLLLFGSGNLGSDWHVDSTLQYNVDLSRPARTVASLRYQPGPFQTLAGTYRYTRGLSEQYELGWQWPVYRRSGGAGSCQGTFYGVGRVTYSMMDSRITDALAGVEYDSGCWIVRVVADRQSTSSTATTTQLMLQLELVGLSRLGSNPLQSLKDSIPGYRLLREDGATISTSP